jgi:leucyl aminopeptidase
MKVNIKQDLNPKNHVIIPSYKDDYIVAKRLTGLKELIGFTGDNGEVMSIQLGERKIMIVGLGLKSKKEPYVNHIRRVLFQNLKISGKIDIVTDHLEANVSYEIALGCTLSKYQLDKFKVQKTEPKLKEVNIISKDKLFPSAYTKAKDIGESMMNVMDLVNLPSNIKTPYYLADYAIQSGKVHNYKVKVFRDKALEKQKLHGVYAVGKGSINPPAFIVMEYHPKKSTKSAKTIGLVGKGISFDTGGISIKPASNMHFMKCDMGGAAAVIGAIEAAAKLQLPHHIIGIIPTAENAVGSLAYRPGDIIDTYSGKSIEVIDTDAEGRIVLADGLSYLAKNYKTDYMIDLATLTGSCVGTLGYFAAGLFSKNDELSSKLYNAGLNVHEKVWALPMWDEYKNYMASDMADIKNLSSVPVAGAITAAKFLEEFTDNHPAYAHLDVAGVVFSDGDIYKSRTATGYGVRLLCEFIENI